MDNRQPNLRQPNLVVTLTQQPVCFGDFDDPFRFDDIEFEIEIRRAQIEIEVELALNNIFSD